MKAVAPFVALTAAALIAAGCSGGPGSSTLPANGAGASQAIQPGLHDALAGAVSPDHHGGDCGHHYGGGGGGDCHAYVVAALAYDSANDTFTVAGCSIYDAVPYTATTTELLPVDKGMAIAPTCAPSPRPSCSPSSGPTPTPTPITKATPTPTPTPTSDAVSNWHHGPGGGGNEGPQNLYIVGVALHNYKGGGRDAVIPDHHGGGWGFLHHGHDVTIVAGQATLGQNPWIFSPAYPGMEVTQGDSYAFFIVAANLNGPTPAPSATPTPITKGTPTPTPTPTSTPTSGPVPHFFHPIVPLTFDGTNFSVASSFTMCSQWWDETPYVATATGPLTLSSSPTVAPTCAPVPSSAAKPAWGGGGYGSPNVYAIGVQLPNFDGAGIHSRNPRDWGLVFPATAIAGPVSASASSWVFPPISPGLNLTSGDGYVFFVAIPIGCGSSAGGPSTGAWCGGSGGH